MPRPKRRRKLTESQEFMICLALRQCYERYMNHLNMHDPHAGYWLRDAGQAWDTYKAFTGYPLHYFEEPRP